ncbi:MAG: hypothetical protein V4496_04110 [Pseudomonadota bacterium]
MIELSPEKIKILSHPYYAETFKEDEISLERYFIEPGKKIIATIRICKSAFDKNEKTKKYLSGLLATRCIHQIWFTYLAWAYKKDEINFYPREFSLRFKKFITQRIFIVILNIKHKTSKSGKTIFKLTADFDNGKLTGSTTMLGVPKNNGECYSTDFMLFKT